MKAKITEILTSKSNDNFDDLVKLVYLSFLKEIDGEEVTLPITIPFKLEDPSLDNFISFSEVNEDLIMDWIFSSIENRKPVIEKMFDELVKENGEWVKSYRL